MNIITHQLQNQLRTLWATSDVCRVFKVTAMTVHTWRQHRGLPALEVPGSKRPAIRFVPDDVLRWAKRNDVPTYPMVKRLKEDPPVKQLTVNRPVPVKRLKFAEWAV